MVLLIRLMNNFDIFFFGEVAMDDSVLRRGGGFMQ